LTAELSPQQAKSLRARQAICGATIDLLVEAGYAETSLNRVAAAAGFSKGALQHHFPSKEDLIAATVNELLSRTEHSSEGQSPPKTVEQSLFDTWKRYINTDPYRALMEIFAAARTDEALRARLNPILVRWGKKLEQQAAYVYESVNGDDSDAVMLSAMNRSFMRGLLVEGHYGTSREQISKYVDRWIELIAPLLKLRGQDDNSK